MPTDEEILLEKGQDESFGFGALGKIGTGASLMGASLYGARTATPGGIRRTTADYASNRLEGFYKKGAWKFPRYFWELTKTGARMGRDSYVRLDNSEFYNNTGISPVVMRDLENIKQTKKQAEFDYRNYKKGYTDVSYKNDRKFAEKKLYFKLSNDKANQIIFGGTSSPLIDKVVGDRVKLTSASDFLKASDNNKNIANFALEQHSSIRNRNQSIDNPKGLQFIKYKPGKFGDVLRATQFDRRLYHTMLAIKNAPSAQSVETIIANAKYLPEKRGGKIMFSLSPQFKPDWDWGGFNSVAIVDPKNKTTRGKIRFIATDVPDVDIKGRPVPGSGGKFPAIKYVESKEITIGEPKQFKDQGINFKANDELIQRKSPNFYQRVKSWFTKPIYGRTAYHKKNRAKEILNYNSLFSAEQKQALQNIKSARAATKVSALKGVSRFGKNIGGPIGIAMAAWGLYDAYKYMKE